MKSDVQMRGCADMQMRTTLQLITSAFFTLIFLFLILFSGCKDDEAINPAPVSLNYVSNDIGRWMIYDCDSILHLDNDNNTDNNVDSSQFQIMEVIDSIGIDGTNEPIQHLSRFKRLNDTAAWSFLARWTAKINNSGYQRVEDNNRYIRLGFPITTFTKWNGNAYNNLGEEEYFYKAVNESGSFRNFSFDSTLTVVQGDSAIGYDNYPFGMEKYATGVGMFYHYYAAVDYYPGTTFIISGVEYYERLNSFGHY